MMDVTQFDWEEASAFAILEATEKGCSCADPSVLLINCENCGVHLAVSHEPRCRTSMVQKAKFN